VVFLRHWVAAVILFAPLSGFAQTSNPADPAIQRGAYLATASDCTACHTAPGGLPFAGGLPIASPVGTIYATNITPSAAGIGDYSEADFARAIRQGIRKDGANLYPAMPYTSYRLLTDADVSDLYAYFHTAVAPVNVAPRRTALAFPMNIRLSMMAWNLLFLPSHKFAADPAQSAAWNRGAYLVNGAAHCDSCHTPRGFLMEEKSGQFLGGAEVGSWYAPNITSDAVSGIGGWSAQNIAAYLKTGILPDHARAAGSMAEAVDHSFQYLTAGDLNAIAAYLKTAPPLHDQADSQSRFSYGAPASQLATLRGANPIRSDTGDATGAELFSSNCAACHAADGQGSKDGYYPSLFHNSATGAANPNDLIATILYGVARGNAYMPGFGGKPADPNQLDNAQIATLASYVLTEYGRGGPPVQPSDVAMIRGGGPSSPLILLARIGITVGAAVFILLVLGVLIYAARRPRLQPSPRPL
jgi:mono/diheme cytochrome c family protein